MSRAVIIGGGHNGLVTAFYLARSGKFSSVDLFERRATVGGACVTEEFHPGFRNSTASYVVGLLSPVVVRDMDLARHGYQFIRVPGGHFVPAQDGRSFLETSNVDETITHASLAQTNDLANWEEWHHRLEPLVPLLLDLINNPAPQTGLSGLHEWTTLLKRGVSAIRLPSSAKRDLFEILTRPIGTLLDEQFNGDLLKGMLAFDAITGSHRSLFEGGGGAALLHHILGQTSDERLGEWGHSRGGMGGITQAMARACAELNVKLHLEQPVECVVVENARAVGVRLVNSSEVVPADVVMGAVHPRTLFLDLVDQRQYTLTQHHPEFVRGIRRYASSSGTLRMNVALDHPPVFTAVAHDTAARNRVLQSSIYIAPSIAYLEHAYFDSKTRGFPRRAVIEMLVPSTLDDTLAPPGKHVASLFCQHFDYDWAHWNDETREQAADAVIDTVEEFAPGFRNAIVGRMVLGPRDLEQRFGLVRGDIFHGHLSLSQMLSARPVLGHARYESPIKNLYLCASGAHPGGGVTGLPGKLAAEGVLAKMK